MKIFEEIVVQYPVPEDLYSLIENRGKPYLSIKYEEDGEHHVGFGTYKPEVLSRYLREYFMPTTESKEQEMGYWIKFKIITQHKIRCSKCNYTESEYASHIRNYCPNCGIKMKEDE